MHKTLFTRTPSPALISRAQKVTDQLVKNIAPYPHGIKGRGIVICGGGYTYFTNAWVLIKMLRHFGCKLPIQLWHLGPVEFNDQMRRIVADFGVECVNGTPLIRQNPFIKKGLVKAGWVLKSVAIARCPFEEVMLLDSDNLPIRDPSFLFDTPQYKATGAIFWPDSSVFAAESVWRVFRVPPRDEPEFESGQLVVDKRINWEAVSLAENMNFRADVYYRLIWGDKDTFRFAWHKLGRSFAMPEFPPQALQAAGSKADMLCQHHFDGSRLFQHRIMYKWSLFGENPWIPGFFFENECRAFLEDLKLVWDGRCDSRTFRTEIIETSSPVPELLNTVWLLQLPQAPPKKKKTAAVNGNSAIDHSSTWIELGFDKNGTLRKNAGREAGIFWDIDPSKTGAKLTLRDAREPKIKLKQAGAGWRGRWVAGAHQSQAKMQSLQDVYPHLVEPSPADAASAVKTIKAHFPEVVHIRNSANGVGDHIVGAYACAGLARTGVQVVFHTKHAGWLARIRETGLVFSSANREHFDHNLEYDYQHQLRYGKSRENWYAGGLHPLLKPVRPRVDRRLNKMRLPFERYILLAPFAWRSSREWPDTHWIRLAHLFREAGYEVVAIGGQGHEERLQRIFSQTQAYWVANHPPAWVMDAMLSADAYVGVDNGMTHVAALLGVKAVAIHSQLSAEFLWPANTVTSVVPDTRCVFCRWQYDRGWLSTCDTQCSALASVRPEAVLDKVQALLPDHQALVQPLAPGQYVNRTSHGSIVPMSR